LVGKQDGQDPQMDNNILGIRSSSKFQLVKIIKSKRKHHRGTVVLEVMNQKNDIVEAFVDKPPNLYQKQIYYYQKQIYYYQK
jgi:hypothetical protein